MTQPVYVLLGVGAGFLFLSIAALRTNSPSQSAWTNELVLPPRWLAPAIGLIPSVQTDPHVVTRGTVFWYWFSITWITFTLLVSEYAQPFPGIVWYAVLLVGLSIGVGWVLASLARHYWPYEGA